MDKLWLRVRASGFMRIVMSGCFNLYVNLPPIHAQCDTQVGICGAVLSSRWYHSEAFIKQAWLLTCLFPYLFKGDNQFASVQVIALPCDVGSNYRNMCNHVFFFYCARSLPDMEFTYVSHDLIISHCTTSIYHLFLLVYAAEPGYGLWCVTSQHTPIHVPACAIFSHSKHLYMFSSNDLEITFSFYMIHEYSMIARELKSIGGKKDTINAQSSSKAAFFC